MLLYLLAPAIVSNRLNANFAGTNGGLTIPKAYNLLSSINPLSTGGAVPDVGNTLFESQVSSVFGYADIGYKNMVYLNITGRNDWTSTCKNLITLSSIHLFP